jgi:hypothetical protein
LNAVDRTEKPTRYLDNDQRVAVQTLVSGGVETDGRMFVFGNTIDGVLIMGYRLGAAWVNFCCGHDSLDRSTVMFYAGGGGE